MSSGHAHHFGEFAPDYDGLELVSSKPWFLRMESTPFRVDHSFDNPYVGGISWDLRIVFVDRKAYPVIVAHNLLNGLIRHERVEGACLANGFRYMPTDGAEHGAHPIATAAEYLQYKRDGVDPELAKRIYRKLIRKADDETVRRVSPELNTRPYSDPPTDYKHLALIKEAQ